MPHIPFQPKLSSKTVAVLLLLSFVLGLAATSRDSFWIDEGNTAYKACQPTMGQWAVAMKAEGGGSDVQMPLYMGWIWAWEKAFGHGEQTLRLANLPWLLLGHAFLLAGLSRSRFGPRVAIVYACLAAVSPFLCFYLNEARPYVMEYGAACLLLAYLLEIDAAPERALAPRLVATMAAGMLLLAGGSLLGVPWAGSAFLAACWSLWKQRAVAPLGKLRLSLASVVIFTALCIGMALLGWYYLELFNANMGAGSTGETDSASCLFAGYEVAGLAGLGPNRAALRSAGIGALGSHALPLAAGCLILFGAALAGAVSCARRTGRKLPPAWMLIALLVPLVFTIRLGLANHFRIVGRHLIAGFPLLLLLASIALESLWRTPLRALVPLFMTAWVCSFASLRFSDAHKKDNYRSAAAVANTALISGNRVWWAADEITGRYYGLDFAPAGKLVRWKNPEPTELTASPEPDLVILSKPNIYDQRGVMAHYLASHGFAPGVAFPAFTVFEKRP